MAKHRRMFPCCWLLVIEFQFPTIIPSSRKICGSMFQRVFHAVISRQITRKIQLFESQSKIRGLTFQEMFRLN